MPKFNGRGGFGRRSGTVTVIEEPVRRNTARNAKIVAIGTWITTAMLAAAILASYWHPIVALIAGVFIGLAAAALAAVLVLAWPIVRVIWWWSAEITAVLAPVGGWIWLSDHTTLTYRIVIVLIGAAVLALIPPVRRYILALAWCRVIRHRIRTCFNEFIITNRTGSLPLILWTRPTPVGVRAWIWLRPGLSLVDVQDRLDLIAVACWSSAVTAEAASASNSARIRLDIKRRDALTATIESPLLTLAADPDPDIADDGHRVPTALDLPDVAAADVAPAKSSRTDKAPASWPAIKPPRSIDLPGDDIQDWI